MFNQHLKASYFCHNFKFSCRYIFATQCRRTLLLQTINSVLSNNLSLKYQRFKPSGFKDIEIQQIKFEV